MIDFITARIHLYRPLPAPIHGGHFVRVDESGAVEVSTARRKQVLGSHEASLQVRAPGIHEIEISGNPAKFVQGHNLWGSDDPIEVLWLALKRLEREGVLPPLASIGLPRIEALPFYTTLSRVDCTVMLLGETQTDVLTYLRSLAAAGRLRDRGKSGLPTSWKRGDGVTFGAKGGKSFTHRSIVFYSKGQEIGMHPLPSILDDEQELISWVNRCLRCEVRLGRLYLRKRGLNRLENWTSGTALEQWLMMMERIDMNGTDTKRVDLEQLPPRLQMAYASWEAGMDLQAMHPQRTFYRYRSEILKALDVDIAIPKPTVPTAEIVPFKRLIALQPAGRPSFADRIDRMLNSAA